jgi:hypothetical protein
MPPSPAPVIEVVVNSNGRHVQTFRVDAAALAAVARAPNPPAAALQGHFKEGIWQDLDPSRLPYRIELNLCPVSRVTTMTYQICDDGSVVRVDNEPPDTPVMAG